MLAINELPVAVVFGESVDRTVIVAFPATALQDLLRGGVLRDFPSLRSGGSTYTVNGRVTTVQHRVPLLLMPRLERVLSGHMALDWRRESSDKDNPQRISPTR